MNAQVAGEGERGRVRTGPDLRGGVGCAFIAPDLWLWLRGALKRIVKFIAEQFFAPKYHKTRFGFSRTPLSRA